MCCMGQFLRPGERFFYYTDEAVEYCVHFSPKARDLKQLQPHVIPPNLRRPISRSQQFLSAYLRQQIVRQ